MTSRILVAAALLGLFTGAASAAEFTFKFAHVLNPDTPAHKGAEHLAKIAAEKSGGRIEVKIFPSGQLGNDTEIVEQVLLNTVQMGIPPTAKLGNFEPRVQLFDLPYIFPNPKAAYAVLDGPIGGTLLETLEAKGLKGVAYWESGFKQMTTNKAPILGPQALKGVKFRTMSSPLIIAQYKAWGANPVPIAFAEVYNALQQGVADAQENSLVSIDKMKFYEVQKHLTISNHAYLAYAFIVNKEAWDALPKDLQAVMETAIKAGRDVNRAETAKLSDALVAKMKEAGIQVHDMPREGVAKFVDLSKQVHKNYEGVIGKDLLDQTYKTTEQYM
ncbi:MAG: TRAP transporter substrate-binding protein [Alphaproteobacteria bacterium]|nr:TRAP transporter substrate-binding protein [Alphaproteobacteria bacterium]